MRETLAYCAQPVHLRRTVTIALVVGIALTLITQADVIASGNGTWATALKVAANVLVPFVVSNPGLISGRPA
jgi:hypothetical protein